VVRKLPAEARRDFRSFGAVLFAMVLFFQFGTEISLGSWLPLMLVQTVGMSPAAALGMLTLYWLALLAGRAMAQGAQSRMRNRHLLPLGVASALLGCLILAVTDNRFGSVMAILFCGVGFAVVYPVLVEIVGDRFRYYHPVYFNGVFSIALTGGLLAPWVTGLVAGALGIRLAMLIPLAGTLVVAMLLIVIWIGTQARKAEV
jgi:fucose permease